MKRYLKDFKITEDFVKNGIYDCLNRGKWKRNDTSIFLAKYLQELLIEKNNKHEELHDLQKMVHLTAIADHSSLSYIVDYASSKIYDEIKNHNIKLDPINYQYRSDPSSHKVRKIGISSIKQQCYDYIAVNACMKLFNAKITHYQCASLSHKGQVFGKSAIETWIRTNPKACKWVFKADIRKFYPSVPHDKIKSLLRRDIKNEEVLYILNTLIDSYDEGLCIGSYLCQYLANYYLSYAYHYVTEFLYSNRRGNRINWISHALFYMDDILLLGPNKKYLKMASKKLEKYLNDKLGVQLKSSYQLFPLDSRPIDMMGYKIYTYKTTIRKRIFNRANKVYRRVGKKGHEMTLDEAYKVIAYNGYFMHSDSEKYRKKVKAEESVKKAKGVISNANKKS